MTAADLYAISQQTQNNGPDRCHWCSSPCERFWPHDDPTPITIAFGAGIRRYAKCPGSSYICCGCRLWRRQRITINYLGGGLRDSQSPPKHSWLITPQQALTIHPPFPPAQPDSNQRLYDFLLKPTGRFVLCLLDQTNVNLIQCALSNDVNGIIANTPLHFTVDNIPFTYNVHQLENAIRNGDGTGMEPGVQMLLRLLGHREPPNRVGKGRPKTEDSEHNVKRVVKASGRQ